MYYIQKKTQKYKNYMHKKYTSTTKIKTYIRGVAWWGRQFRVYNNSLFIAYATGFGCVAHTNQPYKSGKGGIPIGRKIPYINIRSAKVNMLNALTRRENVFRLCLPLKKYIILSGKTCVSCFVFNHFFRRFRCPFERFHSIKCVKICFFE